MKKTLLLYNLLFLSVFCHAQNGSGLKLWYNKPSGDRWENALPIGNGRLGAMIYGNVDTETIQLNEHTIWSGSPNRNDNPLAKDSLDEIRKLIFSGKQKQAEQLANRVIISRKSQGQMFEPAGELHLAFPNLMPTRIITGSWILKMRRQKLLSRPAALIIPGRPLLLLLIASS